VARQQGKRCSQPVSRILSASALGLTAASFGEMTIPLVPALLTGSSNLPGDRRRAACSRAYARGVSLFGLAPCGVLPATTVTSRAVRSYRTFSPLPNVALGLAASSSGGRYIFCATVRRVAPPGNYPAHCPVEFGLSSPARTSHPQRSEERWRAVTHGSGHPVDCNRQVSHGRSRNARRGTGLSEGAEATRPLRQRRARARLFGMQMCASTSERRPPRAARPSARERYRDRVNVARAKALRLPSK
jgi:hypothetical protein